MAAAGRRCSRRRRLRLRLLLPLLLPRCRTSRRCARQVHALRVCVHDRAYLLNRLTREGPFKSSRPTARFATSRLPGCSPPGPSRGVGSAASLPAVLFDMTGFPHTAAVSQPSVAFSWCLLLHRASQVVSSLHRWALWEGGDVLIARIGELVHASKSCAAGFSHRDVDRFDLDRILGSNFSNFWIARC